MKEAAATVDVRKFIDERPFGSYQFRVAAMCGILVFMDGFDAQMMGFVAPALTAFLQVSRTEFGLAISSGLVGMMIGALVCGPLADHFGRKPVLVGCAFAFGICSLITATAGSLQELMLFRLMTGFGLGGAMPNTIALTSEYSPKQSRATAVMLMFCGFSIGAAVPGFVAGPLIAAYGWQSMFIVGGVLPCVIAAIAIGVLPESFRFLIIKGREKKKIVHHLSRIAPNARLDESSMFISGEPQTQSGIRHLFTAGRSTLTLLLWAMFFMNLLDLYFLNSWLPTVLSDAGLQLNTASRVTSLLQVGGTCGALLLGRLMDRLLSFRVLAVTYIAASISIFFIGQAGASILFLALSVFAAGFFVIGGQTSSNALAAEFYPTAIRATGVGWALGIGRVGSIIGPTLGPMLMTPGVDSRHVFWAASIPPIVAMIAAFSASAVEQRRIRE
jgi:AAHS family 4-hydroxybenzoate transporter-like MFS transporter